MANRLLGASLVILVLIGVGASIGRALFPADLGRRMDPSRERIFRSLALHDPHSRERAAEVLRFDSRFAAHPVLTLLHVVPGGLFLALAPFQFSARIRTRHPALHRWSGRVLLLAALAAGLNGLYFGLLMPYAGPAEAAAIALFGGLFLLAMARGFQAIRRRDAALHREWMIRTFAIAIAISTVRVLGAAFDIALAPRGIGPQAIFVLAVWSGWIVTVGAAEVWIRRTRPQRDGRSPAIRNVPNSYLSKG